MTASIVRWTGRTDDPYAGLIASFMGREFPQIASGKTEDVMQAVVEQFLGTKQFRLGPKPNVESQVMIRDVARQIISQHLPIPVLIPVAAVKVPIGQSMDLAELSALRILACLNDNIKRHYSPGLRIHIRLEDLTEYAISGDDRDVIELVTNYVQQYRRLVKALGYDSFIHVMPESDFTDKRTFLCNIDSVARIFFDYRNVQEMHNQGEATYDMLEDQLTSVGWKGGVSPQMYEYLDRVYERQYYSKNYTERRIIMSRYLAAIAVRKQLGATAGDLIPKRWEISFANPLPDAPQFSTRMIYRSIPMAQSSNNMAYWNAKGILRIREDGSTRLAFTQFGDFDADLYTEGQLTNTNNDTTVTIRADYILE